MLKVTKPINLRQLDQEYNGKGLISKNDENDNPIEISLAENNDGSLEELTKIIAKHIAIDESKARETERQILLDKLGITSDEAKLLLG
jgi:hypothetical protein